MKRTLVAAVIMAVSCGESNVPTEPTPVGVDAPPAESSSSPPPAPAEETGDTGNSCPHDAPSFSVGGLGQRIDFSWTSAPKVSTFEVEIDRQEGDNEYHGVATFRSESTRAEWYGGSPGSRYRARVRGITACGTSGVWSSYAYFSLGSEAGGNQPPPAPTPIATICVGAPLVANDAARAASEHATRIPAGAYTVAVEISDPAHAPGYQIDQTEERVRVSVMLTSGGRLTIGTTDDVPEREKSSRHRYSITLPSDATAVLFEHAAYPSRGPHSVHGACATFER